MRTADCKASCQERQAWLDFIAPGLKEQRRRQLLDAYVCRSVAMVRERRGSRRGHHP